MQNYQSDILFNGANDFKSFFFVIMILVLIFHWESGICHPFVIGLSVCLF